MSAEAMVTIEFYGDSLLENLIAAVDVPRKRYEESVKEIGAVLCRVRKANSMDAVILDGDGEQIGRDVVYRRR